ncbi:hypothetical protein Ciccas_005459 [Cichlidogyrus casuarinus]|uniref:Phosphatidic acid phosphatase type 2/haloperoxidase domain-containing protein n=1 Tax=Cichlidogyrus casuarinus TaxID=1844966 RepID=A0ABD2Q8K3_9PLAT
MPLSTKTRRQILSVSLDIVGLVPSNIFFPFFLTRLAVIIASAVLDKGKVYNTGYFIDDQTLMYPYRTNTVPAWAVYVVGVPLTIAIASDTFRIVKQSPKGTSRREGRQTKLCELVFIHALQQNLIKIYRILFAFALGYMLTVFLTVVGKVTIGRLRPHFFDLCDPVPNSPADKYVETFTCKRTAPPTGESKSLDYLFSDMRFV